MQVILGVLFHFIGGFASGSFYIPFKKVKGWHWESYWIVGGFLDCCGESAVVLMDWEFVISGYHLEAALFLVYAWYLVP